ncbi:MAG: lipoyl synthase [Candidatus Cloacimonas sp. SDB]|nr:MAG: lipoyl synthase [Candidatus Cloacimonas sp. SDB]
MDILRKPSWLRSSKIGARKTRELTKYLRAHNLHTVCESARCPNRGECFERGTATFMILGDICTRNCTFCAVNKDISKIRQPDPAEPENIALLVKDLKLKHVVITTVTRDDLEDGGVGQFVQVIAEIKKSGNKDTSIEVLISDLKGDLRQLKKIISAGPDVLNHNVETIKRLYPQVRPKADFERSLEILKKAKEIDGKLVTKSGFMVGLGEKTEEIISLMQILRQADVDLITIGQYMAPSLQHYPVMEYIHPQVFDYYKSEGEKMGFKLVESAPLVRSSYHAEKVRKFLKKG